MGEDQSQAGIGLMVQYLYVRKNDVRISPAALREWRIPSSGHKLPERNVSVGRIEGDMTVRFEEWEPMDSIWF